LFWIGWVVGFLEVAIKEKEANPLYTKLSDTLLSILNQKTPIHTSFLQNHTEDTLVAISLVSITQGSDSMIFKQNTSTKTNTKDEWYVIMTFPKSYFVTQTNPLFMFQLIIGSIGIALFSLLFFIWNKRRIKSIDALTKEIHLLDIAHLDTHLSLQQPTNYIH